MSPPEDVTAAGGTEKTITVTYRDDTALDVAGIGIEDVGASREGGPALAVTAATVETGGDGKAVTVAYVVQPPDGTWDAADNEAYTTLLKEGAVKDLAGNPAVGGPDVFTVTIVPVTPPPAR